MSLSVEIISKKNNAYELWAKSCARNTKTCETLEDAERSFKYELKQLKRMSTAKIENCYKTEMVDGELLIHHINNKSQCDRLVAKIY